MRATLIMIGIHPNVKRKKYTSEILNSNPLLRLRVGPKSGIKTSIKTSWYKIMELNAVTFNFVIYYASQSPFITLWQFLILLSLSLLTFHVSLFFIRRRRKGGGRGGWDPLTKWADDPKSIRNGS